MPTPVSRLLATAALAACVLQAPAHAATAYSLANDGTALIRFDTATPGTVISIGPFTGGAARLDGLDFRPSNGLLYGYSDIDDSVYTVNVNTGALTLVGAISNPTNTFLLGLDFNPAADRLRIVTATEQNLRVDVAGGAAIIDTPLSFGAGPFFGTNPAIIDTAYTNSGLGVAASTTIYYIDYELDSLFTSAAPNSGVMSLVGPVGIDFTDSAGFDIFTVGSTNTGFGAFSVAGTNGLYTINLSTGQATLVGNIGNTSLLYGLAITPVPEPTTLTLWGVAGLAALALRRRSRGKTPA